MEIASGAHVPTRIYLGTGIGSGTSSWWVGSGNLYDVYMADFGVQGSSGLDVQQFIDVPSSGGTLYACQFHALSFNFMRAVFGRKDRTCGLTQVVFTGHWTANNLWDTQFTIGGSDNQLWVGGMINIGPSLVGGADRHLRRQRLRVAVRQPVQDRRRLHLHDRAERLARASRSPAQPAT